MAGPVTDPELLAKLEGGGSPVTDPALLSQLEGPPSKVADFFKSIPTGALQGFSAAASAAGQGAEGGPGAQSDANPGGVPNAADTNAVLQKNITGPMHQPETSAGGYGASIGEVLGNPSTYLSPGGPIRAAVSGAAQGAGAQLGGNLAQAMAPDVTGSETGGRILGAILGGHAPNAAAYVARPNIPPRSFSENTATLRDAGVPVSAGDATNSPNLRWWENDLNPGGNPAQREAYTNAVLKRAGVDSPEGLQHGAGSESTVDTLFNGASQKYEDVTGRNVFYPDSKVVDDLNATVSKYKGTPGLYDEGAVSAVTGAMGRIKSVLQASGGMMTGSDYQTLRSDLRGAAMNASGDKADALHDIVNKLDSGMERSIGKTNPDDQGLFADARDSFKKALVIKKAANMAGAGVAQGEISPAQISSASQSIYGTRYGASNPFSDLGEAGNAVLKPLPDSGTSQRNRINSLIKAFGTLGGVGIGAHLGGGLEAGEGGVLGYLLGESIGEPASRAVVKKALMNPATQAYLGGDIPGQAALAKILGTPTQPAWLVGPRAAQPPQQ